MSLKLVLSPCPQLSCICLSTAQFDLGLSRQSLLHVSSLSLLSLCLSLSLPPSPSLSLSQA